MMPKESKLPSLAETHRKVDIQGHPVLSRLEMACMKAIWREKATTVLQVQLRLEYSRPLAYTTVLTVLDRLVQKGAVTRIKKGRAFAYQPAFSFEESRSRSLKELIEFYFEGSPRKLLEFLETSPAPDQSEPVITPEPRESPDSSDISICLL